MSAEDLQRALAALGLQGEVETHGSLALLRLAGEPRLDDRARAAAVELAAAHGFTHLALELPDDGDDRAPVHRD